MTLDVISAIALERRSHWITEIVQISGSFGQDTARVEQELEAELATTGVDALIDHMRLCGVIPESYGRDSSQEKLYSKYTDVVLAVAFRELGFTSLVLSERADAADVEVVGDDYSFVADAKAFRLSRTAKNQKDFKIQAMDGWKRGKPYAVLVCPLYQLPARTSQIYQQAAARNVCILSYAHLAVIVKHSAEHGESDGQIVLGRALQAVASMGPNKDAVAYWKTLNQVLFVGDELLELWRIEKLATLDAISVAKEEALLFLSQQREAIMRLSRKDAIQRLIDLEKLDSRMRMVASLTGHGLLTAL